VDRGGRVERVRRSAIPLTIKLLSYVLSDPYVDPPLVGMREPRYVEINSAISDHADSRIDLVDLHEQYVRWPSAFYLAREASVSGNSIVPTTPTAATVRKRQQLSDFIDQYLKPEPAIRAVVGVGSIAFGTMRPDSDIDAVILMDPVDHYIVPSEFKWVPASNTFHSIFSNDPAVQETAIQFDFHHHDLIEWSDPSLVWPEGQCAAFVNSWLAYDRDGSVAQLIAERTAYTGSIRTRHLDHALLDLQGSEMIRPADATTPGDLARLWDHLGPAVAFDRALAGYDALVRGLFAYNRRWRPWRTREMTYLLTLPWLPPDFATRVLPALNAPSLGLAGYCQRFSALRGLCDDLLAQLAGETAYGADPLSQAFARTHNQPGYAHNMEEWNAEHAKRHGKRLGSGR
jgi:hypothetical protein